MSVKYYSFGIVALLLAVFLTGSFTMNKTDRADREEGGHVTMGEKLNDLIEHEPKLKGAIAGISIRDAATGDKIYSHMGDIRLRPASNMKLLTAAAALNTLGEDHSFTTEILADGSTASNRLKGNLFLKGKGDPTLMQQDFDELAGKVAKAGIDVIDGDIVADDTWYDDVRLSSDVVWRDEQWYYGAQISALTASPDEDYDAGTVMVEVTAGKTGDKPAVTVTPGTDYVQVKNQAKTVAADGENDLTVEREHGTNIITIDGTMPAGAATLKEWMAVWEPTGYALDLFRQSLEKEGITWTGEVRTGQAPDKADVLYTHESMPLSELLVPFMKLSNNTHAEMLVKEMGREISGEGSWEKGLETVETEMEKLGMTMDTSVIRDGSGISHMTLLPPDDISKLLHTVQDEKWFETYLNALPDAGKSGRLEGGTLRDRMDDLNVQAKTGTIDGVSTLSGYVDAESGSTYIFSIMLNNLLDDEDGPAIEDKIVAILANQ